MDDAAPITRTAYDPRTAQFRTFHDAAAKFRDGSDTPRAYLERCLEAVDAREDAVKAFVCLDIEGARAAADAADARYTAGRPLSAVDGMPVGVKDVIETEDLPTAHGSRLFEGNRPGWDAACVYWLRKGGAYVLGKTVTTEFATTPPGPTRNPWDTSRTPGGSSSGSAAAVGAGMAPVALGTQVRGSVMRPAAYCGAYAIKGTYGVITNQGILPVSRGINHLGSIAASLEDAWLTHYYLSRTAGGEPGHPSLAAVPGMPGAAKPRRIARLETAGWARAWPDSKAALDTLSDILARDGVEIVGRAENPAVETVERLIADVLPVSNHLRDWEGRYPLNAFYDRGRDKLDPETAKRIEENLGAVTPEDYAEALRRRAEMQAAYAALAAEVDACITLTAPDPAPEGFATGDPNFLDAFSVLGVPTVSLPLAAVQDLPLGIQLAGFAMADARLVAHGRWVADRALG